MLRVGVFAYEFEHKKTHDFLTQLFLNRISVAVVIAAPFEDLGLPPAKTRVSPRHFGMASAKTISERFDWPFHVAKHNSAECSELLRRYNVNLGLISGARILKEPILSIPELGILNFHPGLLPDVRGLDTVQWAIFHNKPFGVTAHLIDEKIDRGRILVREEIPLYPDDSLTDISLRLHETQVALISPTLQLIADRPHEKWPKTEEGMLFRKMPAELERLLPELLRRRLANGDEPPTQFQKWHKGSGSSPANRDLT